MNIIAKAKQTIRDHKPEAVALGITAVALTVGAVVHYRMRNFVEFNDEIVETMAEHGYMNLIVNNHLFQVTLMD